MNKENLVIGVLMFVFLVTLMASLISEFDGPTKKDEKWDRCMERVNQIAPDPNDTEERSQILKECYNN